MRLPRRVAQAVSGCLLAQMILAPVAQAALPGVPGPLSPANLQVSRGAPRFNEREGTLDYPVTFTNATQQAIAGPIQIPVPPDVQNFTLYLENDPTPPQDHYLTLPTGLPPGHSFTQVFRIIPSRLESPSFAPFVESIGPVDPATGPAPRVSNGPLELYVVQSDYPLRVRAVAGQEFVWDVDATNPNGGTLSFALGPIPSPTPDLAGATFPADATIEQVTGVFRWTPPAPGLYTARLTVSDGKANATSPPYQLAFQVESPGAEPPPLTCSDATASVAQPGGETSLQYALRGYYEHLLWGGATNAIVGPGRKASCTPAVGTLVGEGNHTVRCQTSDGLWPAGSCAFQARILPGYPIVVINVQDYVNLRVSSDLCPQIDNTLQACAAPGTNSFTVRNTALGVAHDVELTIPIPPEADPEAIAVVTPGETSPCERHEDGFGVSIVCALGDLAGGAEYPVALALAAASYVPSFSPVTVRVTTSTPELTDLDNTIVVRPTLPPLETVEVFVCQGPGDDCPCDDDDPIDVCKGKLAQEWAEYWAEIECRRNQPTNSTFGVLLGDSCEEKPEWFSYVVGGAFAVATLVTGVGVAMAIAQGAANLSIFTAGQVAASAFPIL